MATGELAHSADRQGGFLKLRGGANNGTVVFVGPEAAGAPRNKHGRVSVYDDGNYRGTLYADPDGHGRLLLKNKNNVPVVHLGMNTSDRLFPIVAYFVGTIYADEVVARRIRTVSEGISGIVGGVVLDGGNLNASGEKNRSSRVRVIARRA
jgi:hypothetical protein